MALTATTPPLPTRFKRPTLLVVGCGDVGRRVVRLLAGRWRVLALTRHPEEAAALRALGAEPLVGDLDRPGTLGRLGPLADAVLHLAPPPGEGRTDPRTLHLVRALARGGRTRRLVYASTSGVYGTAAALASTRRDPSARRPIVRGAAPTRRRACVPSVAPPVRA